MAKSIRNVLDNAEGWLTTGFGRVFDFLESLISKERSVEYSAEFGEISHQLTRTGNGFRIGYKWANTVKESNSHMICFGGSGSKKSASIAFPFLLQSRGGSTVVFDTSFELFNGTAQYRHCLGEKVYVLNMDDFTKSIGVNVLAKCRSETDISRIAQVLVKNSLEGSQYDYWAQSAEQMIAFFAYALWKYAEQKHINIANVLNLLQVFSHNSESIDRWMLATGDDRLMNRYKSLIATPEKMLLSTIASATNSLAVYNDPNIAAITSQDTLSFDQLRSEKSVLYLCSSPGMASYTRGVSAAFFDSFFSHILAKLPGARDLDLTFILDEAATIRLNQSLPKILELGRKYRISVCTLWQDYGQVEHIYGKNEAANILANSKSGSMGRFRTTIVYLQDALRTFGKVPIRNR